MTISVQGGEAAFNIVTSSWILSTYFVLSFALSLCHFNDVVFHQLSFPPNESSTCWPPMSALCPAAFERQSPPSLA